MDEERKDQQIWYEGRGGAMDVMEKVQRHSERWKWMADDGE